MKFYIRAEFLDTKLLALRFRRLPEQTRMRKYIYGNFANFNPRAVVNTLCRKDDALQNGVLYQTAETEEKKLQLEFFCSLCTSKTGSV